MGNASPKIKRVDSGPFSTDEFVRLKACFDRIAKVSASPEVLDEKGFGQIFGKNVSFRCVDLEGAGAVNLSQFRDGIARACGRARTEDQLLSFLVACDEKWDRTSIFDAKDLEKVFRSAFVTSLLAETSSLTDVEERGVDLSRLVKSVLGGRSSVTFSDLLTWSFSKGRSLSRAFGAFVYARCKLGGDRGLPGPARVFRWPLLGAKSVLRREDVFSLAMCAESLQGRWDLLYDVSHGRSFDRLCFDLLGYAGPTLVVIRDQKGNVFGAFASCPWSEEVGEKKFFGDPNSFLFSVRPKFNVMRTSGDAQDENYLYLNRAGYSLPHGLAFGGSIGNFRLWLCEDFGTDKCRASARGVTTYERGRLRTATSSGAEGSSFLVDELEVWGLGGEDALLAQATRRDESARIREKMRKVDKARLLDDFTKEFMLGKTFGKDAKSQLISASKDGDGC
eukprot:g2040.t1